MKKKYVGPYEIESEEVLNGETTRITFKDYDAEGTIFTPPVRVYANKTLSHIVTNKPTDFNTLIEKRYQPMIDEIIQVMLSYDLHIGTRNNAANDLDYVLSKVANKVMNYRHTLEDRLWGAEEEEKTLRQVFEKLATLSDDITELKVRPKDTL